MIKFPFKAAFIILCLILFTVYSEAQNRYKVNTERLNVRYTIGALSKPFGYIPYGDTVDVIDKSNSYWYKIKIQNKEGFVRSKYLVQLNETQAQYQGPNYVLIGLILICCIIVICILAVSTRNRRLKREALSSGTTIIVKHKSIGGAIILTLLFGPLGMFYSTVQGALIMLLLPNITFVTILILAYNKASNSIFDAAVSVSILFYCLFYWLICIIWAAIAASQSNRIIINHTQPSTSAKN